MENAIPPIAARFLRYVQVDTTADPSNEGSPSSRGQLSLGAMLLDELREMGYSDAESTEHGIVMATVPAAGRGDGAPVVALLAHLDTSPDAPGSKVRPLLHPDYDGGAVALGDSGLVLRPEYHPELRERIGQTLITSDGTTLLGSDDKAGVAVLMQYAEDCALRPDALPRDRPQVRLCFTVDEEIGRGTDHLNLADLGADVGYTLDGSGLDLLSTDTFNAAEARIEISGVGVHPGYAQGVMVNALLVAARLALAFPDSQTPATTAGREGYFHAHSIEGGAERASLRVLLRDFERSGLEQRIRFVEESVETLRREVPRARLDLEIEHSYQNMREHIDRVDARAFSVAHRAAERMGMTLRNQSIRGGTDGARLSERGLPTPNVFTGGHAFHSRYEWNSVEGLARSLAFTHALVAEWADEDRSA